MRISNLDNDRGNAQGSWSSPSGSINLIGGHDQVRKKMKAVILIALAAYALSGCADQGYVGFPEPSEVSEPSDDDSELAPEHYAQPGSLHTGTRSLDGTGR